MKIPPGSQHRLADELQIEQSYLSRIVRGERTPGLSARKKLLEKLEIPLLAWEEPPEPLEKRMCSEPPPGAVVDDSNPTNHEASP